MIRKSTINLKFVNKGKLEKLKIIANEYQRVVNLFIDRLWKEQQFSGKFVKDTTVDSWLSFALKQTTAKHALSIVKSQRKKKKKTKPTFNKLIMELDSRVVKITQDINSFDIWIKLSNISNILDNKFGKRFSLNLPSKKHFHFNKFLEDGWLIKKSIRLRITEKSYFVDIIFEKKAPIIKIKGKQKAIDIGYKKLIVSSSGEFIGDNKIYEKISRKKQGSKAFKRALIERNELVNISCKALDLTNVKELFAEDLKNVKHKSKGKIHKKFNHQLQRWVYPKVLQKLAMLCEEEGILFKKIPPQYTSQRCSCCGEIHKKSRKNELFKCISCNFESDADYNASLNILHMGRYGVHALQPIL